MASHGLKDQDRLEGGSNYVKVVPTVLEEYDLEAYVKSVAAILVDNNKRKKYKAKQGKEKLPCRARIRPERCGKPCLLYMKALPNNGRCTYNRSCSGH